MSSKCFVEKSGTYFPDAEIIAFVKSLGLTPKIKTGKEQVEFMHINTEASTFGVVEPSKKKK